MKLVIRYLTLPSHLTLHSTLGVFFHHTETADTGHELGYTLVKM